MQGGVWASGLVGRKPQRVADSLASWLNRAEFEPRRGFATYQNFSRPDFRGQARRG